MSLILINAISTLLYDDFIVIVINHLAQIYMKSVNGRKLCACNMPNSQSLLNCYNGILVSFWWHRYQETNEIIYAVLQL